MVVIAGCIIVRDNKILMVKEAKKKCYGQWNFPAGHVDELEKIKQSMKNYVIPENFSKIINSLNNSRILLITGNPGIGKTSLGRALSSYYITKDYELIYTKEIDKANQVINKYSF